MVTLNDAAVMRQMGLSLPLAYGWMIGLAWVARLSVSVMSVILFWRRPDDWMVLALALGGITSLAESAVHMGGFQFAVDLVWAIGMLAWLPLPFIFPNGRIEPWRLRWAVVAVWVVGLIPWLPRMGAWPITNFMPSWLLPAAGLVWTVAAIAALAYRFRYVSTPLERQQTKWVIVGFLFVAAASSNYALVSAMFPAWQPSPERITALLLTAPIYAIGYSAIAICVALAVLRHRLWDIDVVIRRTLIYGLLTALLALVYFGAVTITQQVFRLFAGEMGNAAIIVSTLLLAALFQPLRRQVQRFIDQRFYRRKYDSAQALAAFAAGARDSLDLDELEMRLHAVVDQTMKPAHASLWLRQPGEAAHNPPPKTAY